MRLARVAMLLALTSGCIGAFSLRARVGVVSDELGQGVQIGAGIGIGGSTGDRAGVLASGDVVGGKTPRFGVAGNLDYVHLGNRFGGRFGAGGGIDLVGDRALYGVHAAGLLVLDSEHHEDSVLFGTEYTHTARTLGLELGFGRVVGDSTEANPLGGSVMLSFETFSFVTEGPRHRED
jgi:hypothetical protein